MYLAIIPCPIHGLPYSSCIGYQLICYYGYNHPHIDGYLGDFFSLFVFSNNTLANECIFLCTFKYVFVELVA